MSDVVRKSVGREFHDAGPEKEKVRSPNLVRSRGVNVAGRLRERERERRPERVALGEVGCTISAR